jgi:hypothetical protein
MLKLRSKHIIGIAVVGVNIAALTLPMLATAQTANSTVSLSVQPVLITYTTSGTVTLGPLTPTSGGMQSIAGDTISTNTNDAAGLNVTLQASTASTALTSGGNTIPATTGTPAAPIALASNTWGWRVDSLTAGFTAGPTSAVTSSAPVATKFAALPASGSAYTIENTSSSGSATADVWYSADVTTAQATGSYSNTVLYTATLN